MLYAHRDTYSLNFLREWLLIMFVDSGQGNDSVYFRYMHGSNKFKESVPQAKARGMRKLSTSACLPTDPETHVAPRQENTDLIF